MYMRQLLFIAMALYSMFCTAQVGQQINIDDEAFRQTLFQPLKHDRIYQLRIKTESFNEEDLLLCVNVHFTKWGEHLIMNAGAGLFP